MDSTLTAQRSTRIHSIDFLRGLVMIIMALDHTRDFFHVTAFTDNPLNLETTTPALFLTRWVTHLCAPSFVFLAGASAFFQSTRKSKKELSLFLIKRGLWLIIMELTIINFAFGFDIALHYFVLQVIWAIGISMLILGLMVYLPVSVILAIGLIIVLGHNALDFYEKENPGRGVMYDLLHHVGMYRLWGQHYLWIMYPFLPWTGLMLLGYAFGKLYYETDPSRRKKLSLLLGLSLVLFFILLRYINVYGDPTPWVGQDAALFTFFSFLDVEKYPPSLLYMSVTIGISLLLLSAFENVKNKFTSIVAVYGQVPFFYYILHFFLIHIVSSIFFFTRGNTFAEGIKDPSLPYFIKPGEGESLLVVYLIWILLVIALYPACKWFSNYKKKHKQWWLSYL